MNQRRLLWILVVLVLAGAVGYGLYDFVLGPTLQPSTTMTAVPLPVKTNTAQPVETQSPPTEQPVEETATVQAASSAGGGISVFQIVSEESQASFTIFEELRGSPKNVVGTSNLVSGEIAVNLEDLSQTQVGVIQINARAFATDDNRRNQAIRNRILFTDQYEFVTFTPKEIIGLSGKGVAGQTYTFQIVGDLTIRDVTQSVTFDVTVTAESDTRLTGTATSLIRRSDFGIIVPDVPFVANVADEVKLDLKFTAVVQ